MITLVVQEYLTQSNLILQNISNKNIDILFFWNRYGKGFGLMPEDSFLNQHNSIYGLIFFIIQLLLCKLLLLFLIFFHLILKLIFFIFI